MRIRELEMKSAALTRTYVYLTDRHQPPTREIGSCPDDEMT